VSKQQAARRRPEPRPVFQLTLRAEPHVADTIKALRRGLKFLLRACGLRAISAIELRPDPANQIADVFTELRRDVRDDHITRKL
jgi:hypothetical protein